MNAIARAPLGERINALHSELIGLARSSLQKAITIGELLTEQKSQLKHGEWLPWCKGNLEFSERTVQNYMGLHARRDELKSATVAVLEITEAYRLLAEPTPPAITINPKFRELLPPLQPEEMAMLEALLLKDGCRNPLVTWNGVLLDGHHRFDICQKHGIPFKVFEVELADEDAAMNWIEANQLNRCNLTPDQKSLIRGRMFNRALRRKERR